MLTVHLNGLKVKKIEATNFDLALKISLKNAKTVADWFNRFKANNNV